MRARLNLRHIEAFRAVMVAGSVVGAARLLELTQPGVSRTIGLLELRLGYTLFERRGRRLEPTPEAEALYREVEQAYVGIDRIAQVAQDLRLQRAGALRVATLPALAQWLVPQALARLQKDRPRVTVFVQSLPSRQIAELVSTRQFDVGVIELPMSVPAIEVEPLEPVPLMCVLPASHRLARRKVVSLADLDGERMILLSAHSFVRYQIDDAFSTLKAVPRVVAETPSSSIACAMVSAGVGVTLVSRWTAEPFAGPEVAVRPLVQPLASRFAIVFPEGAARSKLATGFAQVLRDCMAQA